MAIPLIPRLIALAVTLGVIAWFGVYGVLVALAFIVAFHVWFRVRNGRWMEMDGT